jgi:hypothetical protein
MTAETTFPALNSWFVADPEITTQYTVRGMKRCLTASTARLVIGKRASRQLERVGYSDRLLPVVPEKQDFQ